jgi:hypothetical protein
MGRDVISSLGLIIDFKDGRLLWDELELNLVCKALQNQERHEHSSSALSAMDFRVVKILDAAVPSQIDESKAIPYIPY